MTDIAQATFDGWAVVEIFGHQRYAGYVTTQAFGQAVLFRVEVPPLDARDRVTKHFEYIGDVRVPPGSTVQEAAVQGYTKFFGTGAIYALTPCTQEVAVEAVASMGARKLSVVSLAPAPVGALVAGDPDDEDDETEDDGRPF